jgi:alanyl-tRNA synthetase
MTPTVVTYPEGDESAVCTITALPELVDGSWCVVTDRTPFHPLDPWWPDQPSDRGEVAVAGSARVAVERAVLVGVNLASGAMRLNSDKGIKRADTNWQWSVGHVVGRQAVPGFQVGQSIELLVDHAYRRAIACGHTGCHVAAIALNAVTAKYWDKTIRLDSMGNPDTDQQLIGESRILEYGSVDRYRVGKSARKAGLASERFWADFDGLGALIEARANEILAEIHRISVEPVGTTFHERRMWKATLGDRVVEMPCGGVHASDPKALVPMTICLDRLGADEFQMKTFVPGTA